MFKNYVLAVLGGLLCALAWPVHGFVLFLFVGFVPLLLAENNIRLSDVKHKNLHTFFVSYTGFLIWNIMTTWWIWNATKVGGVFAIVVNALLMTLVFMSYHFVASRKSRRFALFFWVAAWIAFEKFHHNWDFSWPWLTLGNAFSENSQWIQWYEYTGSFGGSLWVLAVNVLFYKAILRFTVTKDWKAFVRGFLLPVSVIVLGIFTSLFRYNHYKEQGKVVKAVVLQPNTNPYTEKYYQTGARIAADLIQLTEEKADDSVSFVLAPETVFANTTTLEKFYHSEGFSALASYLQKYPDMAFMGGLSEYKVFSASQPKSKTANAFSNTTDAWYESYNTAFFLANNLKPQVYHKIKLVVGVEHFPFRSLLQPLLGNVMIDLGGSISTLTPDTSVKVFQHPVSGVRIAPVICYESIYGEFMGRYVQKGATVFGIISNDSWWGNTQGHKQLLSYARLHAVAHRRPVIRSANSGISAFINQKGDVIARLDYETKGSLKAEVLANTQRTFYSQYGDIIARLAQFVSLLFLLITLVVPTQKSV